MLLLVLVCEHKGEFLLVRQEHTREILPCGIEFQFNFCGDYIAPVFS